MRLVIASYIEPHHVERIREVDPRIEVVYEPALVASPRYAADHTGALFQRSDADEETWLSYMTTAEVLLETLDDQVRHHWERYAGTDLEGRSSGRSVGWAHGVLVAPKGFRRTFVIEHSITNAR